MIQCPKCQATLPDWATACQFCQADVKGVARPPVTPQQKRVYGYGPAPWVWVAYYLIAGWWVLSGTFAIITSSVAKDGPEPVGIVFGAITAILGIGLALKVEIVRGIANVLAWLMIVLSAIGVLFSFFEILAFGLLGVIEFVSLIINIVTGALLVFVIGETGRQ